MVYLRVSSEGIQLRQFGLEMGRSMGFFFLSKTEDQFASAHSFFSFFLCFLCCVRSLEAAVITVSQVVLNFELARIISPVNS